MRSEFLPHALVLMSVLGGERLKRGTYAFLAGGL